MLSFQAQVLLHHWGVRFSQLSSWCDGGIAAVLHLKPEFKRVGDQVQASVVGEMRRCSEGTRIWSAQAQGAWNVNDEELKATTERYGKELGESVRPWVPATFRILRDLLDTLPRPKLINDDDVFEKIELERFQRTHLWPSAPPGTLEPGPSARWRPELRDSRYSPLAKLMFPDFL